MANKLKFTPYSTSKTIMPAKPGGLPSWMPPEEIDRWQAYEKYDQLYWNDPTQYSLRVLDDETPLYIPNARQIIDTTAHYLLKGLRIAEKGSDEGDDESALNQFLKRERFLSEFQLAKLSGVARGDWCFHLTADPTKADGTRISLESVHPGNVIVVEDEDNPGKTIRVHLLDHYLWTDPSGQNTEERVRKLTYEKVIVGGKRRIQREEAVWKLTPVWWGTEPKPEKIRDIIPKSLLPESIETIPVFWFKNLDWQSWWYGSSDLKGLETLMQAVSQGATDTQASLALDGLGVYATDAGRPVDDNGNEIDWEVYPGGVMEVPQGSYFRRVEGVGSVTPAMDQINYIEEKMARVNGLTDVAMGAVDVAVAQSGIALAIRFSPTLAKIEHRETATLDILAQMFHNVGIWYQEYEGIALKTIDPKIDAQKLPTDPANTLNELNNMLDRGVISKEFYRKQMERVSGYTFPSNIESQIAKEKKAAAELAAATAPPPLQGNALAAVSGQKPPPPAVNGQKPDPVNVPPNRSNNQAKPNESKGTEA